MLRLIDDIIDRWQPGERVDIYREMRTLSNWVAALLLFGNQDFEASIEAGREIERWLTYDVEARKWLVPLDLPGTPFRRLLRQAEHLEKLTIELIERNRRADPPGKDVLSTLIRAFDTGSVPMTGTELVAHTVILYAASFETTSNVLAWTLFLIAQHPEIAANLQAEVSELEDWPPSIQALDNLELLHGVIQESLRLLPPVAFTFRSPIAPTNLNGFPIKMGDKVIISSFLTHRDPSVFPEPNRFRPDRWRDIRPDPYEFFPFSAGSRLCLGYSFGMLELKMTVARIIQRFRLSVVPNAQIDGIIQLTLRPRQGIPMIVNEYSDAFLASPITGNIRDMVDLPT